jgi:imidazole glycerol phosphate synthase glutamine amidotransferase subunit
MDDPACGPVVIVRTGVANTASVAAAFERLDTPTTITDDPCALEGARLLVLPGVGSFEAGIGRLREAGLIEPLARRVANERPTLAICLGMQMLCRASEEAPGVEGIGCVDGVLARFSDAPTVPQIGWNRVVPGSGAAILTAGHAYFANSYRLTEAPAGWTLAWSEYSGPFVAALERGPILACQFHPELSGRYGLDLLSRWLARAREGATA